jgi:hypothetical protein
MTNYYSVITIISGNKPLTFPLETINIIKFIVALPKEVKIYLFLRRDVPVIFILLKLEVTSL